MVNKKGLNASSTLFEGLGRSSKPHLTAFFYFRRCLECKDELVGGDPVDVPPPRVGLGGRGIGL